MSLSRDGIAYRVARDLPEGSYVNLGTGIPVLVANYLDPDKEVFLQSENGIVGIGPKPAPGREDLDLVTAGKGFCTLIPGASLFDQTVSFTIMRGGHLSHVVMGGLEVAANGDFANWRTVGQSVPGVGGAMDLAAGVRNVFIAMNHVTNKGQPKIVNACKAPLTGRGCVRRVFTDIAVIDVVDGGLVLREVFPGLTPADIQAKTEAALTVAPECKAMAVPETHNGIALYQ